MKKIVEHNVLGKVEYNEDAMTGKKTISINGVELVSSGKNSFLYECGDGRKQIVTLKGSLITGITLVMAGDSYVIVDKPKAYEWVLGFLPFILNLVWGNSVALCSIIPVVGGAIGGAISGGISALALYQMQLKEKFGSKVIVSLLCTILAFAICFAVAELILSAI